MKTSLSGMNRVQSARLLMPLLFTLTVVATASLAATTRRVMVTPICSNLECGGW